MLRGFVKTGLASALYRSGTDRLIGRLAGGRNMPLIICYHRVVEDFRAQSPTSLPGMLISCSMLERHLDWIGRRFRFVDLDEVGARLESGEGFDEPVASITFDDGYRDSYEHAYPLLKRKGIPAAIFVVTDSLGTSRGQLPDILYLLLVRAFAQWPAPPHDLARFLLHVQGVHLPELERTGAVPWKAMRILLNALPQAELQQFIDALAAQVESDEAERQALRPLSWDMVDEMHRAGLAIGSHTRTHPLLPKEAAPKVLDETAGSREHLESRLGSPIRHFAYPNGWFNAATVRAVAASGYRCGYTICGHRDPNNPLLTIPRKCLWENSCLDALGRFSAGVMSSHVHGIFDLVTGCRQDHREPNLDGPVPPAWQRTRA